MSEEKKAVVKLDKKTTYNDFLNDQYELYGLKNNSKFIDGQILEGTSFSQGWKAGHLGAKLFWKSAQSTVVPFLFICAFLFTSTLSTLNFNNGFFLNNIQFLLTLVLISITIIPIKIAIELKANGEDISWTSALKEINIEIVKPVISSSLINGIFFIALLALLNFINSIVSPVILKYSETNRIYLFIYTITIGLFYISILSTTVSIIYNSLSNFPLKLSLENAWKIAIKSIFSLLGLLARYIVICCFWVLFLSGLYGLSKIINPSSATENYTALATISILAMTLSMPMLITGVLLLNSLILKKK